MSPGARASRGLLHACAGLLATTVRVFRAERAACARAACPRAALASPVSGDSSVAIVPRYRSAHTRVGQAHPCDANAVRGCVVVVYICPETC
eukprot:13720347-Alexandrium_andersonii.AAC.1